MKTKQGACILGNLEKPWVGSRGRGRSFKSRDTELRLMWPLLSNPPVLGSSSPSDTLRDIYFLSTKMPPCFPKNSQP